MSDDKSSKQMSDQQRRKVFAEHLQAAVSALDMRNAYQGPMAPDRAILTSLMEYLEKSPSECPYCHGNDRDAPCAYPSEGKPGCLRDERLADETFAPPSDVADGYKTALQVDVTSDMADKVHRCCMEIQQLMLHLPAKHDVMVTVSQIASMPPEEPAGRAIPRCPQCLSNTMKNGALVHDLNCPARQPEKASATRFVGNNRCVAHGVFRCTVCIEKFGDPNEPEEPADRIMPAGWASMTPDQLARAVIPEKAIGRIGRPEPNNDMVICPTCTSQFVAIPVNVQERLQRLNAINDNPAHYDTEVDQLTTRPWRGSPNDAVRWVCPKCRTVNANADERCCVSSCEGRRPDPWPPVTRPGRMPPWAVLLLECRDALPAISLATAKLRGLDLTLADRIEKMLEPWKVPEGKS